MQSNAERQAAWRTRRAAELAQLRGGETISTNERIAALEAEVTRWKADCEAIQKGQLMPTMDEARRMDRYINHIQAITTDIDTYNLFRRCLHPDSRNSVSDDVLHKAWLAFRNLEPRTYDKSKLPPPLPNGLTELFRMKEEAGKKRAAARSTARAAKPRTEEHR